MNKKNNVKITAFTGEEIEMKSALVSGITLHTNEPMSIYSGSLNLSEIHEALFYAHRAVLKMLLDEFEIPLEHAESFLLSSVTEAVTAEYNARVSGEPDVDIRKIVKHVRKSQN